MSNLNACAAGGVESFDSHWVLDVVVYCPRGNLRTHLPVTMLAHTHCLEKARSGHAWERIEKRYIDRL